MARFSSLYSGSSGNCSVVQSGERFLLVDMGKGIRSTGAGLKKLGLSVENCAGILVTHEHTDHTKGLSSFLKKYPLPVYGTEETLAAINAYMELPRGTELCCLDDREEEIVGFGVRAFPVSHDVPCVGYRIETPDGKTMTIATDLGILTKTVHRALEGANLVALESNYDTYMLQNGNYPYRLKLRINGAQGHLSNEVCSQKVVELIRGGCKRIALCHLSYENNTPMRALQAVYSALGAANVIPTRDCIVQAQRRNEVSPVLEF